MAGYRCSIRQVVSKEKGRAVETRPLAQKVVCPSGLYRAWLSLFPGRRRLVVAFSELLDHFAVERFQVARAAACDKAVIDHYFLVDPVSARVLEVEIGRAHV